MVYVIFKGKGWGRRNFDTKKLTPVQRIESLYDRNFKPSGDKKADNYAEKEVERIYNEAKNEQ